MQPRFNHVELANGAFKGLFEVEKYLRKSSLPAKLFHLVKLRASQINGCAYCLDMHWKDLRALGETEQRLYSLDAWRECPWYDDKERAALEWTEAVTLISQTHARDEIFERVRPHFTDQELADLTWNIATINAWNRMAIAARTVPGGYQPGQHG
ncbi:MAG: carboxymuconolactone decarboxylase family protein [Phycisphaerales bacterium]|nr:carboxymuconolactone decarboxylase family protein [Phycisphaerales bacterium]